MRLQRLLCFTYHLRFQFERFKNILQIIWWFTVLWCTVFIICTICSYCPMPYHQRIPHVIRFTVGKQWTSVQSLMPVHQTVEILQSEQKSWTVQQTELHTTCMANNHNSCISFHSWFTVAPLQPEAGSCLSRSPLSARLFGSGTVSANREGFFFSYKTWLKTYCFLLTNIQPIYCLILMQLINVLFFLTLSQVKFLPLGPSPLRTV